MSFRHTSTVQFNKKTGKTRGNWIKPLFMWTALLVIGGSRCISGERIAPGGDSIVLHAPSLKVGQREVVKPWRCGVQKVTPWQLALNQECNESSDTYYMPQMWPSVLTAVALMSRKLSPIFKEAIEMFSCSSTLSCQWINTCHTSKHADNFVTNF
jgi:hypothetical protein